MKRAIIRKRGTLVIPAIFRERNGLEEGAAVEIEETGGGIMIRSIRASEKLDEATFWKELAEGFAALRADPLASAEYDAEFAEWDSINDGLEDEPPYEDA